MVTPHLSAQEINWQLLIEIAQISHNGISHVAQDYGSVEQCEDHVFDMRYKIYIRQNVSQTRLIFLAIFTC